MSSTPGLRNMASVYLTSGERLLLLYRQGSRVVNNVWIASAGGHFEPSELSDPKACVLREMGEELSLSARDIRGLSLRYIAMRRVNGEIRQNYYFFAELINGGEKALSSDEGELRWFGFDEVGALEMPYSAKPVVEHYLAVGRYDEKLRVSVADGEKVVFTELPEY